ncbi:cell division protein FtsA [Taibaiella lutea]|uniref:Cell division protein FtsA n=1 Tax=Taibaiella lutea TaxID=2608001 RepID=A0A5M6CPT3_9BACT|nr:cell division protein FtsA [Taibaiella lutea]KAA5537308.1 cell division protein FtsA [Taibaiella lutea]
MNRKEQPIIVGLDIGTTKVVAIAGRKNEFGKLEVLGFGKAESAGVSHGVVLNIEQCIRSIEQAIEKCVQSNPNLEINEVYVGIAGQHIKSLQTRGDRVRTDTEEEITKDDIDKLIKDQYKTYIPAGDQIIDIIPQDFMIDNTPNVHNPIGMSGIKVGANFHIVTGDRNAIRNIKRCVDKSNLKTNDLVLQPLASAAAVMNNEDLEAGVAIVDIGGGTTDMAVFYDGILQHTAVIPYAGTNITNDIRQGLGVLRAQAEAMKVQFGMALADEAKTNAYITIPGLRGLPPKEISVKNLAHIIQARTEEILDYVMYHLKQINLDKKLFGGIILTGGGSQLNHLIQLTEFKTGMGARIGQPNEHLAGGHHEELKHPMYATCIGLILRGYSDFETGRFNFNSSNKEISIQKDIVTNDVIVKVEIPKEKIVTTSYKDEVFEEEETEQTKEKIERNNKRSDTIKKVIYQIKSGFMSLFEEPGDQQI